MSGRGGQSGADDRSGHDAGGAGMDMSGIDMEYDEEMDMDEYGSQYDPGMATTGLIGIGGVSGGFSSEVVGSFFSSISSRGTLRASASRMPFSFLILG